VLCGPAAAAPGRAREHRAGVGARASARVRVGLGAALGRGGARACAAAARCGAGSEASHTLSHQPRSVTPRNSTSCAGTSATPPTRLYSNSTAASRRPAARAGRVRMPLQRAHGHANLGRGSHPEPHQNMIGTRNAAIAVSAAVRAGRQEYGSPAHTGCLVAADAAQAYPAHTQGGGAGEGGGGAACARAALTGPQEATGRPDGGHRRPGATSACAAPPPLARQAAGHARSSLLSMPSTAVAVRQLHAMRLHR